MSAALEAAPALSDARGHSDRLTLALYTTTVFVAAFLLFLVQPMMAKEIMPTFGGSPSVWIAAMLFFQAALLAGYLFVYVATRYLGRAYRAVHVGVVAVAALGLPIGSRLDPPLEMARPTAWVMLMLLAGVGAPFFALAMSSPALQRWFSLTHHRGARDPYFLYVASNAGSLCALLAYPVLVERLLPLGLQEQLWSAVFVAFVVLSAVCSRLVRRDATEDEALERRVVIAWATRLRWVFLAFVPSSLMLGVTSFISADVAALPLFWVAPLALYLVTFIVGFAQRPPLSAATAAKLLPLAMLVALPGVLPGLLPVWAAVPAHLAVLFLAGTAIHGRLAAERPPAANLAEFYVLLSLGGVLGGVFASLAAPQLFVIVLEYPLLLAVAILATRPVTEAGSRLARRLPWGLLAAAASVTVALVASGELPMRVLLASAPGVALIAALLVAARRSAFSLAVAGVLALLLLLAQAGDVRADRTFFGVLRVKEVGGSAKQHVLMHGTTVHGRQNLDTAARAREPLTYYARSGPAGDVFRLWGAEAKEVAVIGLGVGTLAAYGEPGQRLTFFEIDPAVVSIARDETLFRYLRDSRADADVVVADGRLGIAGIRDGSLGLVVVDAFSSDAIPVHLLTREAISLYASKLRPGGAIAFNLSSRYFDLAPVVGAAARDLGLVAARRDELELTGAERTLGKEMSSWLVLVRHRPELRELLRSPHWHVVAAGDGHAWTDDFSNPLRALKW